MVAIATLSQLFKSKVPPHSPLHCQLLPSLWQQGDCMWQIMRERREDIKSRLLTDLRGVTYRPRRGETKREIGLVQ